MNYFVEAFLTPPAVMAACGLAFMWLTAVPDPPIARWRWWLGGSLVVAGVLYFIGAIVVGVLR